MKKYQKLIIVSVLVAVCCVIITALYHSKRKNMGRTDKMPTHHLRSGDQQRKALRETLSSDTASVVGQAEDKKRYIKKMSSRLSDERRKKLLKAYNFEMSGRIDESLEMYQTIVESSDGSEQIGALNRYRMALRRKFNDGEGLKKEIDRIKEKSDKSPFELAIIAPYNGVDERQCYQTLLDKYPESVLSEYAELNVGYYYNPSEDGRFEEFLPTAIQHVRQFILNYPYSAFVPHAKLRIASCYDEKNETREEAVRLYKQLLKDYHDDKLICSKCIIGLYWLGVLKELELYKAAKQVSMFYGTYGDGYYLKDFDPEAVDFQNHPLVKDMLRELPGNLE